MSLLCTFRLAGQLFGVDVLDVKEITTEATCTPVPHAPPEVRGYVNLRGQIHLVLDLRQLLGLPPAETGPASRLVIFKPAVAEALAALVDAVSDIVSVAPDQVEPRPPLAPGTGDEVAQRACRLVAGTAKLDGQLVTVLAAGKLAEALSA